MSTPQKLLKKIQSISENKLTVELIIPLLEVLGYKKVEFNGGVYEDGKDIILWYDDRFENTKVSVAQVKHFKLSNKASGNDSLQTVVNQLENCIKKPILYTDKKKYLPTEIILISSYPINTNTLKTRFSEHETLKDHNIDIIDGNRLTKLLLKNCMDIVDNLLGIETNIPDKISPTLNNEILLKALGYNNKISIKAIYTDINFNLGKRTPRVLLNEKYDPIEHNYDLTLEQWREFRGICESLSAEYEVNFLNRSLEDINSSADLTIYNKWQDSLHRKEKNHKNKLAEVEDARLSLRIKEQNLKETKLKKQDKASIAEAKELVEIEKSKVQFLEKELSLASKQLETNKIAQPKVLYKITIDGYKLSQQIIKKHDWIITQINGLNSELNLSISELKNFLKKAETVISTTEVIFRNPLITNCLKSKEDDVIGEGEIPRLSIDIHKIFDTGLNFLVLGEAGAGKTTTLQMYAHNQSQLGSKMPIWISLSRMIQYVNEIQQDNEPLELIQCINIYLNKLGISTDVGLLEGLFKSKKTVLLLDGLDEAIKPGPWLPEEINRFSKIYNFNTQIIVSSRLSTKEINTISFFSITLMPFTTKQRNLFIRQWFSEINNDVIYRRITKHLEDNREVAEIVRNPLLTTTLCVLAENNLALPRTEINLYNDRIKLLTGYYDNVKNIVSRITITPHHLETLSSKLAFFLHSNNTREGTLENLISFAADAMKNHLSREQSTIAVHELIDPCNILIPMEKNGQYGFGHLRYQEHLAAKEILGNRSIKIQPLLKNQWWKGVFTIFSKLNDNIEWLIKDLGQQNLVNKNQEILFEIIAARPNHEQESLVDFVQKYLSAENGNL
ncbi:hypothetical protein [Sphingobacterium sp. 40-24]|uniref:NACHT domain-containing protein n=1 Tax=Sphingobacterium sp. 40-24 TaxID=1895843 RepID=UPI000959EE33|nr:hypothetical protein [Sphingobacterium sp. 40-24]OJZ08217.1 MAG: hypothetical protein BGP15_26645 [Sphingobacterium sp. 40-24]